MVSTTMMMTKASWPPQKPKRRSMRTLPSPPHCTSPGHTTIPQRAFSCFYKQPNPKWWSMQAHHVPPPQKKGNNNCRHWRHCNGGEWKFRKLQNSQKNPTHFFCAVLSPSTAERDAGVTLVKDTFFSSVTRRQKIRSAEFRAADATVLFSV